MLTKAQRKGFLSLIKNYKSVNARLSRRYDAYESHYANSISDCANYYLNDIESDVDKIAKCDIKYYTLLVSAFGEYRREFLLNKLQKNADFDVFYFVEQNNRRLLSRIFSPTKDFRKEISKEYAENICEKYKSLCREILSEKRTYAKDKKIKEIRKMVYGYARAIVNNTVTIKPENLRATQVLLGTVCYTYCDGDVADLAKKILKDKIAKAKSQNLDLSAMHVNNIKKSR